MLTPSFQYFTVECFYISFAFRFDSIFNVTHEIRKNKFISLSPLRFSLRAVQFDKNQLPAKYESVNELRFAISLLSFLLAIDIFLVSSSSGVTLNLNRL